MNAIGVIAQVTSEANSRWTRPPVTPLVQRPHRHRQVGRNVVDGPQRVDNGTSLQSLMIRQRDHRPIRIESHAGGHTRVLRGRLVRTRAPSAVPFPG